MNADFLIFISRTILRTFANIVKKSIGSTDEINNLSQNCQIA